MKAILYVIDALRADHLSCYGYSRQTSPNLDQFAGMATLFGQAFTTSTWTRSAAGSILTGTYPSVHGAISSATPFRPPTPPLARTLQAAGIETLGISAIGNVSSGLGFGQGFGAFVDLYKEPALLDKRQVIETDTHAGGTAESHRMVMPLAEDANEWAFRWLEEKRASDFFLFMWVIDPHNPYWPPEGYQQFVDPAYSGKIDGSLASIRAARTPEDFARLVDLYDSEIYYTDHCFGELCGKLQELDLWDETLVMVTGDHGEAFYEHNNVLHGHVPYEELLRVPLIARFPGEEASGGARISEMVTHLDIAPTIVQSFGVQDAVAVSGYQGQSLQPLLHGQPSRYDYVYSECQPSLAGTVFTSIRSPRLKFALTEPPQEGRHWGRMARRLLSNPRLLWELVRHPTFYWQRQMSTERELLFNLEEDPHEHHNLRDARPELAAELKARILEWRERNRELAARAPMTSQDFEVDEETINQLKGLGYL